ncbi:MAG: UvrD-helicase domain-containing protein [Bacteroidales bacterium]|nr:UvrD-helicase domain-containing protein [Bacteroidales bacterium]
MNIIKASAGSGKTYRLSHTYLEYLLNSGDPFAYRHLLAVTFTNKATAEMKARILRDLAEEARSNSTARHYLLSILHDYGAFGVSTIDRFFQQTLRAFARELGQHNSWQVELDKASLIDEAVDRVLDGLTEEKTDLADWLRSNALEQISRSKRFRLDEGLAEMGGRLKNEEFRQLLAATGLNVSEAWSKERLKSLRASCNRICKEFEDKAAALGITVEKDKDLKFPSTKKALDASGVRDLFEGEFAAYATACIVRGCLYSLGVAREFEEEYGKLLNEKNVLPLDESNTMLRDIIDGSDAPFVYEKTGTRYAHYLLDEFQDTSRMQWDNFLPLLHDADAAGANLIVGDVKQSIYRWRDSDWRLLGSEVQKEFPSAEVESPDFNWRSASSIVEFNSDFFSFAAEKLGLKEMYANVKQEAKSDEPQEGCVRLSFTSDQAEAVLESVKDVRSRGALYGDIAILVRGHKEGAVLAEALISAGVPVISDDSLDLKSAVSVRRLVSLLTFYDNPANSVGSYIARSIGITFPEAYHSLIDFCESLLRDLERFDPETFRAEALYISTFMDRLQDWVTANGNNLRSFIRQWNEKESIFIGSPENSDAVRILTIHKSKGLEFPHVIFPFAEKVVMSQKETRWCVLNGGGTSLGHELDGIYPVSLSGSSVNTLFAADWEAERALQLVDNMNLFYVALTRASKSLHVISRIPAAGKLPKLKKGLDIDWSNFSELLYAWSKGNEGIVSGVPYDFSKMSRKPSSEGTAIHAGYVSVPLGGRLHASEDALDYFGEDGHTGAEASGRLRGIELHAALALADSAAGLPLDMDPESRAMLTARIEAHPEWFSGDRVEAGAGARGALRARNEITVFGADGSRNRPDRVVMGPDGSVTVIDYKFGAERDSYLWQVRRYMKLYRQMGFKTVRGYVWYVPEDKVVEV